MKTLCQIFLYLDTYSLYSKISTKKRKFKFFMQKAELKKNWSLTPEAFEHLLEWLDEGVDSAGRKYLEMRQKLVAYFDRKNCLLPDDLADETLNRVARRIVEEGKIESDSPAKYCYITARFVFMEYLRSAEKNSVSFDEMPQHKKDKHLQTKEETDAGDIKEKMLGCLESCTEKLEDSKRKIILNYYYGEERVKIDNRRALAAKLGISVNALSIRACRIRNKLETCVGDCAKQA